jgi:hypothetical protein
MSYGCHRKRRAEEFQRSNFVSHMPKAKLRHTEAKDCIDKFESYFHELLQKKEARGFPATSVAKLKLRKRFKDYTVEVSGNSQSGRIVVRSGLATYAEYTFTPRAIHVYKSEQEGNLGSEAAIYLHRRLPQNSVAYGIKTNLKKLMNHA